MDLLKCLLVVALAGCSFESDAIVSMANGGCTWHESRSPELDQLARSHPEACVRVVVSIGMAVVNGAINACDAEAHQADLRCAIGRASELRVYQPLALPGLDDTPGKITSDAWLDGPCEPCPTEL